MTKKEHLLAVRPNIESDVFSNVLNDVLQAMENYSNDQLILSGVVGQSEQLHAYTKFLRDELHLNISDTWVESYVKIRL